MLKQSVSRIKRVLIILFVVLLVASLTAAAASAVEVNLKSLRAKSANAAGGDPSITIDGLNGIDVAIQQMTLGELVITGYTVKQLLADHMVMAW